MSDSVSDEPILSEPTGTFHYQEQIESRLGLPIAADISAEDAAKIALSPGATLAAGRNAMGWSVEQVASQLRLARRQILSLEADDYAALPEPAIVRGFIRAYGKLVKLDADALVALIIVEPSFEKTKPLVGIHLAISLAPKRMLGKKSIGFAIKLVLAVTGLALLALLVFGLINN